MAYPKVAHFDASTNAFFEKALEHVSAQTYDKKFPPLRAREFIPVNSEVNPGAETYTYYQYDHIGMAKLIKSYADDLPAITVSAQKFSTPIESVGLSYGYSVQEIRAAQYAQAQLDVHRAVAARRAFEQKVDSIAQAGDAATGMKGFLNHANVPIVAGLTGAWSSATAAQMIADVDKVASSVVTTTKETEMPDTAIFPVASYSLLAATQVPNSNMNVLNYILANSPWIKNIGYWDALATAGAGSTKRMMIYRRDPMVVELLIPQEFEQFPPQERNLSFVVPCHGRVGGIVFRYPLAAAYGDGL